MARDAALRALADTTTGWLYDKAIPLWLEHGVDRRRGGPYDALDPQSLDNRADFKRLRVTTRQIYVFVEAALHGVAGARAAVDDALDFLRTKLRHPAGGFAGRCDLDGIIVDETRDLYDLAFTLFALAHGYRLTAARELKDEALALAIFVQAEMRHPSGGYVEALPSRLPRRQNPHMHLLEAVLACAEHMPHPLFDALCDELGDLAAGRFIDAEAGLLFEYYDDGLIPARTNGRALVEPGHHFEWAWLLAEFDRVRGRHIEGGACLAGFALRHGLDRETGFLHGELFDDGTVATASVRLWPHCEWLKAMLVLEGDVRPPLAALARFLDTPVVGLWHEWWDADARAFRQNAVPASSLYHITSALTALERHAG